MGRFSFYSIYYIRCIIKLMYAWAALSHCVKTGYLLTIYLLFIFCKYAKE